MNEPAYGTHTLNETNASARWGLFLKVFIQGCVFDVCSIGSQDSYGCRAACSM